MPKNAGIKEAKVEVFDDSPSTLKSDFTRAGLSIRSFRDSDIDAVRQIFVSGMMGYADTMADTNPLKAFWKSYVDGALVGDMKSPETLRSVYFNSKEKNGGKYGHFWVAVDIATSEIVGTVGVEAQGESECELRRMSVLPGFRKAGLGKKLVRQAEEFAVEQGFSSIMLTTGSVMVPAMRLYSSAGFEMYQKAYPAEEYKQKFGGEFITDDGKDMYEAFFRKPVTSNQGRWMWQPHKESGPKYKVEEGSKSGL